MTMEEAREEVSKILLTLEEKLLISLCVHLKCSAPVGGFASKTRRNLIRLAETKLDEIEEGEDSPESYQLYASLKPAPGEVEAEIVVQETSELEKLRLQYQKLQQQMEEEIGALEEKIKQKTQAAGGDTLPAIVATKQEHLRTTNTAPTRLPEVTLRWEFRIIGQIGEAGQKDKLSYTSLINQIEAGQRKGHGEAEIIEAVFI